MAATDDEGTSVVELAHQASARGDWARAFELFTSADVEEHLALGDLPAFAEVAYAAGDLDVSIELWERAHAGFASAGDPIMAAASAVRVAMHLLFDTALLAPVRGWLARAEQLLEGHDPTPAHAWCAVVRAYERFLIGDLVGAAPWARRAVEIGALCDPAACAVGRVASARIAIAEGAIDEGLALLDDAGVTATSGDLDPLSSGVVYCEVVCALQGLAQYDLAEQWTDAMERWSATHAIGSLHGRCRVHRAEILRLRGRFDDAEAEVLGACDELRPYLRRELGWPLAELGRIRLLKGDVDGAHEAAVAAHEVGWDPHPALALVQLAQGDVSAAAAAITDALDRPLQTPSKELPPHTDLRRAPLLGAQVEIALAAGDLARARAAAQELTAIGSRFRSAGLIASAALAAGRVEMADGDASTAVASLSEAVHGWSEIGAPYEAAVARLALADALDATGATDRAVLERSAAQRAVDELAAARVPPATTGVSNHLRRRGDVWTVQFEGRSCAVPDRKGMHHLARLLAVPGQDVHVLDLVAAESGGGFDVRAIAGSGPVLDDQAKQAYRRRIAEIDDDIAAADAAGDVRRSEQAHAERVFLLRELAGAVGLGGRDRRGGEAAERARVAVTRALRQAIARLADVDDGLGAHLDHAIRTGTLCRYEPDPRVPTVWEVTTLDRGQGT